MYGCIYIYIYIYTYNQITGSRATAAVLTHTGVRAFSGLGFSPISLWPFCPAAAGAFGGLGFSPCFFRTSGLIFWVSTHHPVIYVLAAGAFFF